MTTRIALLLSAAALLAACATADPIPTLAPFAFPDQVAEIDRVWHGLMHMDAELQAPPVNWVDGQTCPGGNPMWPGILLPGGTCAAGLIADDGSLITLVKMPAWHQTALVHELVHFKCQLMHGDQDGNHDLFPDEWALVGIVNDAIAGDAL